MKAKSCRNLLPPPLGWLSEFLDTLELIKSRQEVELINKGLKGEFNASIAKLMLANHGYSEKQTLDHQSQGSSIISKSKPMRIELVAPDKQRA